MLKLRFLARFLALWPALLLVALAGCSSVESLFGLDEDEEPRLSGERISILKLETVLEPDPALATEQVSLPAPVTNEDWQQPGGVATHAMHHLAAPPTLAIAWNADVGDGESDDNLILSSPVVASGRAFLIDSSSTVHAYDIADNTLAWSVELAPEYEEDEASLGGGVAFSRGRLFVTTAFGHVFALDAASGLTIWQASLQAPVRGAPTVAGGRVFAITYDNRLNAIDGNNGDILWTHEGIVEGAGLLGSGVPAVFDDLVVAPYSSGELIALRVENGRVAWADSLIFQGRFGAGSALRDIDGSPVIDRGVVYAVSQSGRLVAIELRTGRRLWDQEVSGAQTPWIAGEYLYVLTSDANLVCLRRRDGRIRWVSGLPRFEEPEERSGLIVWAGPVLIGDRLLVASNRGDLMAVSPYTGSVLGRDTLPDGVRVPPVVANGTVFVLTMEAELIALR